MIEFYLDKQLTLQGIRRQATDLVAAFLPYTVLFPFVEQLLVKLV